MDQNNTQLIQIDSCDSSNTEIWKYFKSDKLTILITKEQTSARGRLGRSWQSTNGALNLTIAFAPNFYNIKNFENISWLTLIAGMSLRDALIDFIVSQNINFLAEFKSKLHLKWPNDLYFENKKIAGILCESKSEGNTLLAIVLGFGMNINSAPNNMDAVCLNEVFSKYSQSKFDLNFSHFAHTIIKHFEMHLRLLITSNFSTLKSNWLKSANTLTYLEFQNSEKTKNIHFLDLSLNGNCIILDKSEIKIIF